MSDPNPQNDAAKWKNISSNLRRFAEAIPPTDWLPAAPLSGDPYPDEDSRHAVRMAILQTYQGEVLQECVNGLAEWFELRTMPILSQPAKYWLRRMAVFSAEFCESQICELIEGPTTIVPFPTLPPIQVVEWLLGEWWANVGLKRFVAQATTDQSLFYAAKT